MLKLYTKINSKKKLVFVVTSLRFYQLELCISRTCIIQLNCMWIYFYLNIYLKVWHERVDVSFKSCILIYRHVILIVNGQVYMMYRSWHATVITRFFQIILQFGDQNSILSILGKTVSLKLVNALYCYPIIL